jgi:hypothetical protein
MRYFYRKKRNWMDGGIEFGHKECLAKTLSSLTMCLSEDNSHEKLVKYKYNYK